MKKILVALTAALFAVLLTMTASAASDSGETEAARQQMSEAQIEIVEKMQRLDISSLDYDTQAEIIRQTFLQKGLTEAENGIEAQSVKVNPEVRSLAYSNADLATPEMKEKILNARKEIIYSYSWSNDLAKGVCVGYSVNLADQTFQIEPKFSELFPGWEVPSDSAYENYDETEVSENEMPKLSTPSIESASCAAEMLKSGLSAANTVMTLVYYS